MRIIILLFCLIPSLLFSATLLEVSLDGTKDYTSINEALDNCNPIDMICVYPGEYNESVIIPSNFLGYLFSTYVFENDPAMIAATRIRVSSDQTCIVLSGNCSATIRGFTISNDIPSYIDSRLRGGGISISGSDLNLQDCIIENCTARYGGGLFISEGAQVNFSNSIIRNNHATSGGGGITIRDASANFHPLLRSSIYKNHATKGMDIYMYNTTDTLNICLDTFSKQITEFDNYFVAQDGEMNFTFDIQNSFYPSISNDLYVSPSGDDLNSGLTPSDPLKTIRYAMCIIEPPDDELLYLHLASGVFITDDEERFPVLGKKNLQIIGEGIEETIIDVHYQDSFIRFENADNVSMSDLSVINCSTDTYNSVIELRNGNNISLSNITVMDSYLDGGSGLTIAQCDSVTIDHVTVENCTADNRISGMSFYESSVTVNYSLIRNIFTNGDGAHTEGMHVVGSKGLTINNTCIIQLGYERTKAINFEYYDPPEFECDPVVINNCLFSCMSNANQSGIPAIEIDNPYSDTYITNCTFAFSNASSSVLRIYGNATIRNSILYHPNEWEIGFYSEDYPDAVLDIDYCCIENGTEHIYNNGDGTVLYGEHNIDLDPNFWGDFNQGFNIYTTEFYQLMSDSPCIDAGTPDISPYSLFDTDIFGIPRVIDGIVDIGCAEFNIVSNEPDTQPILPRVSLSHYPNPVILSQNAKSSIVKIEFNLLQKPKSQPNLSIYNIKGQLVKSFNIDIDTSRKNTNGSKYQVNWDLTTNTGKSVSSGIYLYQLKVDNILRNSKMVVVK